MEIRTKEEIMEKFYDKAYELGMPPEELARVPWPLLEQMLFPGNWEEEDFETDAGRDAASYIFESGHMGVEEANQARDLYNSVIAGKKQGHYSLQDYYNLPDNVRAELIDGVLYFKGSPSYLHQLVAFETAYQISSYIREKQGECHVIMSPLDVQLDCDDDTIVQPDIMVSCKKEQREEWGICGAPDMVVEITSPSTRGLDMKKKLEKYRDAGVREYWIIDLQKRVILTYFFEGDINPHIYNLENEIPVAIFEEEYKVKLSAIADELRAAGKEWAGDSRPDTIT